MDLEARREMSVKVGSPPLPEAWGQVGVVSGRSQTWWENLETDYHARLAFFFFFLLFRPTSAAYGSSQARGQIRAAATGSQAMQDRS